MLREPFVIGPVRLYGLTWAPNGRSFAYYLTQNGNSDIYVMDVRTKAHRQLTFDGARDWSPAWSPNGKWIAFVSERAGNWGHLQNGRKWKKCETTHGHGQLHQTGLVAR